MKQLKAQSKIYEEVAKELGLSKYAVEDAWASQFDLVAKTMQEKKDRAVRLPKFGTFLVKLKRREYLNKQSSERQQEKPDRRELSTEEN